MEEDGRVEDHDRRQLDGEDDQEYSARDDNACRSKSGRQDDTIAMMCAVEAVPLFSDPSAG